MSTSWADIKKKKKNPLQINILADTRTWIAVCRTSSTRYILVQAVLGSYKFWWRK